VPAVLDVFFAADEDLWARDRRPPGPRSPGLMAPCVEHLISTDPGTSIVADDRGRPVAFGILMCRGAQGFLSFLFVRPEWQGRGLGRAVLDACLHEAPVQRLATCADAVQPISAGLYASLGWAPRAPIYVMSGSVDVERLPALDGDLDAEPLGEMSVDRLDRQVLGYERPGDHAFWVREGRRGWVFRAGGELRGYGYTLPDGRIGPVLAQEPKTLPAMLGHLIGSIPTAETQRCLVPGPAIDALKAALRAGLRIDGSPSIYCADHEPPLFDRYLPMSTAHL
jgi:GNAT superfamily N-acetyltransferase